MYLFVADIVDWVVHVHHCRNKIFSSQTSKLSYIFTDVLFASEKKVIFFLLVWMFFLVVIVIWILILLTLLSKCYTRASHILYFLTMINLGICLFRRVVVFLRREIPLVVKWIRRRLLLQKTRAMDLVLAFLGWTFQVSMLHFWQELAVQQMQ